MCCVMEKQLSHSTCIHIHNIWTRCVSVSVYVCVCVQVCQCQITISVSSINESTSSARNKSLFLFFLWWVKIWVSECRAGLQNSLCVQEPHITPISYQWKVAAYISYITECINIAVRANRGSKMRRGPDFTGVAVTMVPRALMNNKICDN